MVTITLWRCAAGDTPCADNTLPSATVPGSTPLHANSSGFHSDWFNLAPMTVQEATVQLAYFAAVRPYVRDISSRNTTTILLTVVSETDGRRNGGNGGNSSTGGGDETHRDAESLQLPPSLSLVANLAVPAVAAAQVFLLSNPPFSTPAAPPVLHPAALLRSQLLLLQAQLQLLTVLSEAGGGGGGKGGNDGDGANSSVTTVLMTELSKAGGGGGGGDDGHGGTVTTGDGGETDVGAEPAHIPLSHSSLRRFSCTSIGAVNAAVYQGER